MFNITPSGCLRLDASVSFRGCFLPAGTWPSDEKAKKMGAWHMKNHMAFVESITPKACAALGWADDEIEVLIAKVKNELRDGTVKIYNDMES
jgi:hypothetical protein